MNKPFDDISRILAAPMPRRKAFKLILSVLAGGTAVTMGVEPVLANDARNGCRPTPKSQDCPVHDPAFVCVACTNGIDTRCCPPTSPTGVAVACYSCPNNTNICCAVVTDQACVRKGKGYSCRFGMEQ